MKGKVIQLIFINTKSSYVGCNSFKKIRQAASQALAVKLLFFSVPHAGGRTTKEAGVGKPSASEA